ncbi:caspase family protein [Hymenobacter sp. BT507]|uniref:Caspase family protein n=1 Tax=Hymenobacter citatus TaxID=2763506 RepID=A0ABR7MQ41_9BACT|nr:caspase family protein [Hymenobacter citatus]MBC6613194.1 caspase family protein [Hymenobacter citatus]
MANKLFLMGIDKYNYHPVLNNCVKDIIDFKEILLEKYDFDEEDVFELYNEKCTNINIQNHIQQYSKLLKPDDSLIIYYSGHGYVIDDPYRGFWVPVDGNTDYTSWIANETLIALLDNINCKHIVLISDSCFSATILATDPTKAIGQYAERSSRWGLASAFDQSFDSPNGINSQFAEAIIHVLNASAKNIRISELIEKVKFEFNHNPLQAPQGGPLRLKAHKGGEYIFTIKQNLDTRDFKGYNNFLKILKLYKRNSVFNEVKIFEDRTKKIGFKLFMEIDEVVKSKTYYLYLYEGIYQSQTYNYLKQRHSDIFSDKNLIIFLPKEKDQTNLLIRKTNVQRKFKSINTFYIDEFIRKQCTPKVNQDDSGKYLNISNFIIPSFNGLHYKEEVNHFIDTWFKKDSEPILVVKGTGGVGKTTFAQFIADNAIAENPDISIIFIDSLQIKDILLKSRMHHDQIRVYDFYAASFDYNGLSQDKLNEEIFNLNIDAGNIMLIIDGLDEVISKIPNFAVEGFIKSIDEASNELGGGKVIITCRSYFWDKAEYPKREFMTVELQPFNKEQMVSFFQKSFNAPAKEQKALKLAEQFKYPENDDDYIFHPYVLDIIRSIVDSSQETIDVDLSSFGSNTLNPNIKNDYIIYRICDRERKRVGQILVDDQVKLFIHLAIERRGLVLIKNFKNEIEDALGRKIDLTTVEAFKSHPFLKCHGSYISFKYDFFADLFKSIYIAKFFNFESYQTNHNDFFIEMISENCWLGSAINNDIVNRIVSWNENDLLLISDTINQINKNTTIKEEKRRKIIANIFNLCIEINHKFFNNNVFNNTKLLKDIFETSNGIIENLSIINVNADQNIRFSFESLTFNEAYIDNLSTFWDCNFDSKTQFNKCHLLNLKLNRKVSSIDETNFIDCVYDHELDNAFKIIQASNVSKSEQAKIFLSDFFHLFFSNGRLGRQYEDKVIKPRFTGIDKFNFGYKKTIRILKSNNVLKITTEMSKQKFEIEDNFKEAVVKFIKDGTISEQMKILIVGFSE